MEIKREMSKSDVRREIKKLLRTEKWREEDWDIILEKAKQIVVKDEGEYEKT